MEKDHKKIIKDIEDYETNKKNLQEIKTKMRSILEVDNSQKNMFDINSFSTDAPSKLQNFQNYNIQKQITKANKEKVTFDFFERDNELDGKNGGIVVNISQLDYDYGYNNKNNKNNRNDLIDTLDGDDFQKKGMREKEDYETNDSCQRGTSTNNDNSNRSYTINKNNERNIGKFKENRLNKIKDGGYNNTDNFEDEVFHFYKSNKDKNKCYKFFFGNNNKIRRKITIKRNGKFCQKHPYIKWLVAIIILLMLFTFGVILIILS